jgi:hypothetical protein
VKASVRSPNLKSIELGIRHVADSETGTETTNQATHVVVSFRAFSDAGSTPAASTKLFFYNSLQIKQRSRVGPGATDMTITLNIPEDIVQYLRARGQDISHDALEAFALEGYRSGKLSQAQIRRLLGYGTRMEVDQFLKEHGIALEYTREDLERESAIGDRLWRRREEDLEREAKGDQRAE